MRASLIIILAFCFAGCTSSDDPGAPQTVTSSSTTGRVYTIQKTTGINVGESNSIWGVGMIAPDDQSSLTLNVERISLTAGDNYSKMAWRIPMTGNLILSNTGTRTFLSEWGLLLCRGSSTTGDVGLFAVDYKLNTWTQVFTAGGADAGSRCFAIGYHAQGSDGKDYSFVAFTYIRADGALQMERFLVNPSAPDLATRFTRVTPYAGKSASVTAVSAVYNGFLFTNCKLNGCFPKFYGGVGNTNQIQGFDLTSNVPPTSLAQSGGTPLPAVFVDPPNLNFQSVSHPFGSGPFGSINNTVYSMGGDPDDGYVYRSADPTDFNNFVAYDSTNQLVYRANRQSQIGPKGTDPAVPMHSVLSVFKRGCFFDPAMTDCNPITTKNSLEFTDVGPDIGPASDLGNGCIALVGLKRLGEPGAATYNAPVSTACVRDGKDLTKGLTVTRIGSIFGATYMYGDFTGATLVNLPVSILFDFTSIHLKSFTSAKFFWVANDNSSTLTGLNISYRCYPKGATPPAFKAFPGTPPAFGAATALPPDCGSIAGSNQVEFQLTRIPGQRFTRLAMINVSVQ